MNHLPRSQGRDQKAKFAVATPNFARQLLNFWEKLSWTRKSNYLLELAILSPKLFFWLRFCSGIRFLKCRGATLFLKCRWTFVIINTYRYIGRLSMLLLSSAQMHSGLNILLSMYYVSQSKPSALQEICKKHCKCDLFAIIPQLKKKYPIGAHKEGKKESRPFEHTLFLVCATKNVFFGWLWHKGEGVVKSNPNNLKRQG